MFARNNIYLITHYSQLSPCGHTTMTTERLLGLAMVNIHFEKPIDYDAVVHFFAERYRRVLLTDPVFEENPK